MHAVRFVHQRQMAMQQGLLRASVLSYLSAGVSAETQRQPQHLQQTRMKLLWSWQPTSAVCAHSRSGKPQRNVCELVQLWWFPFSIYLYCECKDGPEITNLACTRCSCESMPEAEGALHAAAQHAPGHPAAHGSRRQAGVQSRDHNALTCRGLPPVSCFFMTQDLMQYHHCAHGAHAACRVPDV